MECSTVAGSGGAVSRNNGGTELAAIALAWFTLDGLSLRLLKFGPTYLLRKVFWLGNETTGGRENTMHMRSEVQRIGKNIFRVT